MSKTVRIPTLFHKLTSNEEFIEVNAATIGDVIMELSLRFPSLGKRLIDEKGEVRRFLNYYVNGEDTRLLQNRETRLKDGDQISIVSEVVSLDSAASAIAVANYLQEQRSN